ncbi:hypothetical protein [Streptomyces sp. SUK 48]|nr:hypothetical protein [Streptomyces sp. SUK 48]
MSWPGERAGWKASRAGHGTPTRAREAGRRGAGRRAQQTLLTATA